MSETAGQICYLVHVESAYKPVGVRECVCMCTLKPFYKWWYEVLQFNQLLFLQPLCVCLVQATQLALSGSWEPASMSCNNTVSVIVFLTPPQIYSDFIGLHISCLPQNLSIFRVEANMIKARSSDESIGIAEALRYLRATKFNSSKAIEIFRNYHVRASWIEHLSNLLCWTSLWNAIIVFLCMNELVLPMFWYSFWSGHPMLTLIYSSLSSLSSWSHLISVCTSCIEGYLNLKCYWNNVQYYRYGSRCW